VQTNQKRRNIRFPDDLWERLCRVIPEGERSEFVRAAVEAALTPVELAARVRNLEAALRSVTGRDEP
jgi:Arc/MetJ-type ribon-helix-helix transcriptional regulator